MRPSPELAIPRTVGRLDDPPLTTDDRREDVERRGGELAPSSARRLWHLGPMPASRRP